jgi:hypothetical protein
MSADTKYLALRKRIIRRLFILNSTSIHERNGMPPETDFFAMLEAILREDSAVADDELVNLALGGLLASPQHSQDMGVGTFAVMVKNAPHLVTVAMARRVATNYIKDLSPGPEGQQCIRDLLSAPAAQDKKGELIRAIYDVVQKHHDSGGASTEDKYRRERSHYVLHILIEHDPSLAKEAIALIREPILADRDDSRRNHATLFHTLLLLAPLVDEAIDDTLLELICTVADSKRLSTSLAHCSKTAMSILAVILEKETQRTEGPANTSEPVRQLNGLLRQYTAKLTGQTPQ